ncbi:MAG TPA: hypothetical protein VKT30_18835 [Caulobacteraceae bacterium]|nr:hypothetical protein [Caulobacteraceae bacterium]
MRVFAFAIAALATLAATSARPDNAAPNPPPPEQQAAQTPPKKDPHDPNEVICRRVEELGTRLGGEKVCMTRAQWDDEAWDNKHAMDDAKHHTLDVRGN